MSSSRKYPYPLGWKFQGGGGSKAKVPSVRGGYGYFLELHNTEKNMLISLCKLSLGIFGLGLEAFSDARVPRQVYC